MGKQLTFKAMVTKESSINDIIDSLGIIRHGRSPEAVKWEYNGKIIPRPEFKACYKIVRDKLGIDSDMLKVEGYYKD